MLLFCKKNNVEASAYSVLTPTFIIEPILYHRKQAMKNLCLLFILPNLYNYQNSIILRIYLLYYNQCKILLSPYTA